MHFLVVDNNEVVQKICTFALEKGGHTVEVASTGVQALKLLSEHKYDFLFLELFLRDMNALSILEKVKDQNIISVIITSYHSVDLIRRAIELGASTYIFKPIDPDNIEATIVMCKQRHDMEQNRIEAKNKLIESQQKYKTLVDGISEGIAIIQNDTVRFVNKSMAEMLGQKIPRLVNKSTKEVFAHKDAERVYRRMMEYMEKGVQFEGAFGFKNFAEKNLIFNITANKINFENKPAFLFVFNDMTERIHMTKQIEKIEDRYRILHENASDAFFLIDQEGGITEINSIAETMLGYQKDELQKMNMKEVIEPSDASRFNVLVQELVNLGGVPPTEIHFRTKEGESVTVSLSAVFIDFNSYLLIACNLSEVGMDENDLREIETLRHFVETVPAVFYRGGSDGKLEYVNSHIEELSGYKSNEFVLGKRKLLDLIHPADRKKVLASHARLSRQQGVECEEYRIVDKFENVHWVCDTRRLMEDPKTHRNTIVGILHDMTRHKRLDSELAETADKYRVIMSNLPVIVYSISYNGEFALNFISPYVQVLLGYSVDDCSSDGRNVIINNIHLDDAVWVVDGLKHFALQKQGEFRLHYRMLDRNGGVHHVVNRGNVLVNAYGGVSIQGTIVDVTVQLEEAEKRVGEKLEV